MLRGGGLSNADGLRHILSIGYEVECGVLAKLTRTVLNTDSQEIVLFNSDTARKDIEDFQKAESGSDEQFEDYIFERQEEVMEDVILDKHGQPNKNAVFNITSDNAMTPFIRLLDKVCYYDEESENATDEKNSMYVFRDTRGTNYNIHFMMKSEQGCAFHSSVEWIMTYYKPKRSPNVIMDTFINMITNLVRHLDEFVPIEGNYIVKYKNAEDAVEEFVVEKPNKRMLFHKPGSTLYYLQTQASESPMTIDDACSVVQMTFSAKAEHIVEVLVSLFDNNSSNIPTFSENIHERLDEVRRIERCVDELIRNYNVEALPKGAASNPLKKDVRLFINNHAHTGSYKVLGSKHFTQSVKTYLFLILFKLAQYVKFKGVKSGAKYFKNILYINSRHSNYVLYNGLKRQLELQFGMLDEEIVISIIKDIVFVPEILMGGIVTGDGAVRTGAFSKTNVLDKTNKHYGDPTYSLMSYFDFFERPVDNETNVVEGTGEIKEYDWLEYKKIDDYSNKMDLNDDVVLIEVRNFQKLLSLHVYDMADSTLKSMADSTLKSMDDSTLKSQMESGSCNVLTKHMGADVGSLSIANFRKIIELYNGKSRSLTRRKSKTRSRTRKNSKSK